MKLISIKSGFEVKVGDEVVSFRGEKGRLEHFDSRRVYVKFFDLGFVQELFPQVIGVKVVE
jgi:hypothetical protein